MDQRLTGKAAVGLAYFDEAQPIGWLITKLAATYEREFVRRVTANKTFSDVTVADHRILRLMARGPCNSNGIAQQCGVTKQAISKSIKSLEGRRYVARKVSVSDRRAYELVLTGKGHKLLARAIQVSKDLDRITQDKLGQDGVQRLKALLLKSEGLFCES